MRMGNARWLMENGRCEIGERRYGEFGIMRLWDDGIPKG